MTHRLQIFCAMLSGICMSVFADSVQWGNKGEDTVKVDMILSSLRRLECPTTTDAAKFFIGKPYVASTLEGDTEVLRIRLDAFDCTTFVETCIALAAAYEILKPGWTDFTETLTRLRYRDGIIDGYPSRLHYISDWIENAEEQDLLCEVTSDLPKSSVVVKDLNFMSRHPQAYSALRNSPENVMAIKRIEGKFRGYKMPYIPAKMVNGELLDMLMEGDIVAFTTDIPGLDVSHIGLITMVGDIPHLLHASSTKKQIVLSPGSLAEYLGSNKRFTGIRIFRACQ